MYINIGFIANKNVSNFFDPSFKSKASPIFKEKKDIINKFINANILATTSNENTLDKIEINIFCGKNIAL